MLRSFLIQYLLLNYFTDMESTYESWIEYDNSSEIFSIQNIPFGVCHFKQLNVTRCCSRIGDYVIDLFELERNKLLDSDVISFSNLNKNIFNNSELNFFIELGRPVWKSVRERIQNIFKKGSSLENQTSFIHHISTVEMRLPVKIQDYTDFYSSKNHAFNMGKIIRGEKDALQPNWVHLPVGYHGRSSTIVVDGSPIIRPRGQTKPPKQDNPIFSECKKLDYEVEVGVVVGKSNEMGKPVKVKDAEDYIFGLVLLNDWSARDIQTWEYVPLGPFNAKNFATTISPWIVTLEALEPFKVELPKQDPEPLKYLQDENLVSWDIPISVGLRTPHSTEDVVISTTNYKYMYWTIKQQIAHHTVTGCKLNVGDLLGSGTISRTDPGSYGSMFELSLNGAKGIPVGQEERTWLNDGDVVNFSAVIKGKGFNIGFGNCSGRILPANPEEEYY